MGYNNLMQEPLVPANKYNKEIVFLKPFKQINPDYPILVRDTVAKKLAEVASKLPGNLFLQIDSGHRNFEVQKNLWQHRYNQFKSKNPNLSRDKVYKITRNLVFDPSNGIPPHTTGGAVDISCQSGEGDEINLSSPFKKYYEEPKLISKRITKKAQGLRIMMNRLMLNEGFAPNEREYWHFSYGDLAWAKYYKKKVIYGEIHAPKKLKHNIVIRYNNKLIRAFWRIINNLFKIETNY
jgi:D-alanyl-D-alanine dipeptidase